MNVDPNAIKKALLTAFVLTLSLSPAIAQQPAVVQQGPSLHLGAGGALPISDGLSFLHGPGLSFTVGLGVPVAPRLEVIVDMGYTRLLFDDEVVTGLLEGALPPSVGAVDFGISGGAYHFISGTAGLRWTFATLGRAAFYLSGGTGIYYSSIGDPDVEVRDAEGNPVGEGTGTVRGGEDTSYGFSLGAGVRLPIARGMLLFVEPRYAWILEDTQYLAARVGLSFSSLFNAPGTTAWSEDYERKVYEPQRYEVSVAHHGTFFSDGDVSGWAYHASVSRPFFSERTGLALGVAYRRAVDTEIRPGFGGWSKRQGMAADLMLFVDALHFTSGTVHNRLRVGFGPTLRRRWGEWPRSMANPAAVEAGHIDVEERLRQYDRVYRARLEGVPQEGIYLLFTDEFRETAWGLALKLQYDLIFGRVVVGPGAGFWLYGDENVIGYGLHLGWRL